MIVASALLAAGLAAPVYWLVSHGARWLGYDRFLVSSGPADEMLLVIPGAGLMGAVLHLLLEHSPPERRALLGAAWGIPLGLLNLFLSGLVQVALYRVIGGYALGVLLHGFGTELPRAMITGAPLAVACGAVLGTVIGLTRMKR